LLYNWITNLVGGVFPAQEDLVRLAMDWAPEILGNLGMNLNAHLMECIGIISAPFLLSRKLVSLTIRLLVGSMRNGDRK